MSIEVIVIGVDGSEGTRRAVEWTADLANEIGARVLAVHTYEPLAHLSEVKPGTSFDDVRDQVERRLQTEWCEPLRRRGVEYEAWIEEGNPAEVILETAREMDADLVVVGARRLGVLRGLALGSTSTRVIHEARRPVVVIHGD